MYEPDGEFSWLKLLKKRKKAFVKGGIVENSSFPFVLVFLTKKTGDESLSLVFFWPWGLVMLLGFRMSKKFSFAFL